MPRTTSKSAINAKPGQPKTLAKLLEALIPGPVTKQEFEDIFQNFKKAFVERARNADESPFGLQPRTSQARGQSLASNLSFSANLLVAGYQGACRFNINATVPP